ncbi:uncharacterized protein LOC134763884 [Penaeus indicus]|uniref:uncharacterized protein LOC134763884 n=1 Tax=Penaeus indicus TaxID=29960 RepID=UPI00300DA9DA
MGKTAVGWLTEVFKDIMETEQVPGEWRTITLIPIFKNKGDIQDCSNYRGIKLTSHTLKMWKRIIDKRLRNRVVISDHQFGFMPNRSTTDTIFTSRKTCVRCAVGDTEEFEVTVGLHQGSALSSFLFAVITDCLTAPVQREAPWDMLFADDVVVCAVTKEEVEQRLELWREAMEVRGMEVSRQKTEYLKLRTGNEDTDEVVEMQGEVVKQAWKKVTGIMCDRKVSSTVKGKLQDHGKVRNVIWHGSSSCHERAGKEDGSGRNENAEVVIRSYRKGQSQERGNKKETKCWGTEWKATGKQITVAGTCTKR